MILKFFDVRNIPIYLDTAEIEAVYSEGDDKLRICLAMHGNHTLNLWKYCAIMVNGVKVIHDGTVECCTKIIDIIGEIMYLEREEPKVDMDRFAKLGKTDKKKSK